jgi:hypothetical protein
LSSSLPFVPFRNVIDGTVSAQEERVAAAGVTQLGLMKAMMTANGIPPSGFEEQPSSTTLLDMAPFKIVASSVWSSPSMVGIIATLSSTIPGATIPIVPTNIQLKVPQFGALRIMGADSWELSQPIHLPRFISSSRADMAKLLSSQDKYLVWKIVGAMFVAAICVTGYMVYQVKSAPPEPKAPAAGNQSSSARLRKRALPTTEP